MMDGGDIEMAPAGELRRWRGLSRDEVLEAFVRAARSCGVEVEPEGGFWPLACAEMFVEAVRHADLACEAGW
jgi:hypothetical protein